MKNKKIAYISLLSALAIVFGYIEGLFPAFAAIPGIKLGISNIVILLALYQTDKMTAYFIMIIKVLATSLLFSGMNVLLYSFCGGVFSISAMICCRKLNFSIVGISMIGGISHNIGQLLVAGIVLKTVSVIYYFPVLLLSGLVFGFITGIVSKIIISRLEKFVL